MDRKTEVMGWLEGLAQDDWMNWHSDSEVQNIAKAALALLKEQPEIVRCRDCKHKEESVSPSWEAWCNRLHCGCDNDWFCADGERRAKGR